MVTGGARSGKSEFAERYVLHYSPKCDYVATAEILDEEMAERVRLHRQRRDARWINHEAPIMPSARLKRCQRKQERFCLTA